MAKAMHDDYGKMADAVTQPITRERFGEFKGRDSTDGMFVFEKADGSITRMTLAPDYKSRVADVLKQLHLMNTQGYRINKNVFVETRGGFKTGTITHTAKTNNPRLNSPEPEDSNAEALDHVAGNIYNKQG